MANKLALQALLGADFPLDQKISGLIMCIAQGMKVEATRKIKPTGLSLPQLMLLHTLDCGPDEGLTVNQLKATMLEENSNVSRALNKLVEAGYVKKIRNDDDQRIVHIQITDSGSQAHRQADHALMDASLGLEQTEQQHLYTLLAKVISSQQD